MFGYQKYSGLQAKGLRPTGTKIIHIVSSTMTASLLQSLMRDKLCPESCGEELEIQVQKLSANTFFFFKEQCGRRS